MRKIAIYGKGGIGKSTISQNIAVAMSKMGQRVMLVGCDPKADSTRLIMGGTKIKPILESLRKEEGYDISVQSFIHKGCNDIFCVESGGPEPGIGCAGRGIITAIELLEKTQIFDESKVDVLIFDVLGDVVCGGFAMPIREGKASEVYIVCSGECQALYAANNIAKGIARFSNRSSTRLGGIICNRRNVKNEAVTIAEMSNRLGTTVIGTISRSDDINIAESVRKTVVEYDETCNASREFFALAGQILNNTSLSVPTPLNDDELDLVYQKIWN